MAQSHTWFATTEDMTLILDWLPIEAPLPVCASQNTETTHSGSAAVCGSLLKHGAFMVDHMASPKCYSDFKRRLELSGYYEYHQD